MPYVEKPFGVVLKELSHNGTPRTPSTAAWGMRYPARTLLILTISMLRFPVTETKINAPRSLDLLDSWGRN
ncbi:hypothetical protein JCM15765_45820 [Paradesulfitobacterium aromaticivorans]